MKKALLYSTLGFALIVALNAWLHRAEPVALTPIHKGIVHEALMAAPPKTQTRSPASQVADPRAAFASFRDRYGAELSLEFDPQGRLTAIRGGVSSRPASGKYRSDDPQQTIARAKEILNALTDPLGIRPELPVGNAVARADASSAQVYFTELSQGLPVQPGGTISVDLGPDGQLLGLYSSYLSDLEVTGSQRFSSEDARRELTKQAVSDGSYGKIEGGEAMVWVSKTEQGNRGRRAFGFAYQGRKWVVDAETGEVIARKDSRNY